MLALARRVVVPAAVLTNNGPPLSDLYRELLHPVATLVPTTLFSGHTRLVKPNRAAFLNACAVIAEVPSDVLLIDDSRTNTAAASRAGLQTHHYQSAERLEKFLDHQQLLAPR